MEEYRMKWIYAILFSSMAQGPISTILTLYLISNPHISHGEIYISLMISGGTIASIISTYLFGKITDKISNKNYIIIFSYIGVSFTIFIFLFLINPLLIVLNYFLYSFFSSAPSAPINIIIMETVEENLWKKAFSNLQFAASFGSTLGFIISFSFTFKFYVMSLLYISFILSVVSLILIILLLPKPRRKIDRREFLMNIYVYLSRAFSNPFIYVRLTNESFWKTIKNINFEKIKNDNITYLSIATFIFYIGSGLFNTMYPAAIRVKTDSDFMSFLILSVGMIIQTSTYLLIWKKTKFFAKSDNLIKSLFGRGLSYLAISFSFMFPISLFIGVNLIFYPIAAGLAFSIFYTVSNIIAFEIIGNNARGRKMGLYTAMIQIGVFVGSLLSGYISESYGYTLDFIFASFFVLISSIFFYRLRRFA
ncbi:MAG: MFS transporter [Thermoplasmata archaeon]